MQAALGEAQLAFEAVAACLLESGEEVTDKCLNFGGSDMLLGEGLLSVSQNAAGRAALSGREAAESLVTRFWSWQRLWVELHHLHYSP